MTNEELIVIVFAAMFVALLVAGMLAVDRRPERPAAEVIPARRPDEVR